MALLNDKPLVSVIMNCYNGEKYLREAIDSIYAQTYPNWEIIFWDNASADSSGEIARCYDEKLKYYRSSQTTLLGKARVLATHKADGDYLAFLDVDDIWHEDKLIKQINQFEKNEQELGFVYGRTEIIFELNKERNFIHRENSSLPIGDVFAELAKENFIMFSSVIIDKYKFFDCGGFPEHFKNSTDYWIFLKMTQKYSIGVVEDVCCKCRIHSHNLSASQYVVGAEESIEALSTFLPDYRAAQGLKYQYVCLAVMYIKEIRFIAAVRVMLRNGGWKMFIARLTDKLMRVQYRFRGFR